MDSVRDWISEHKLTSIGTLWASAIGTSLAYTGARSPLKTSLRLIHARFWCSLIFEPYLIERHRLEHVERNPHIILLTPEDRILYHYSLEEGRQYPYELPKDITRDLLDLSASCHGLLLLSDEEDRIHVCNPATRELITLPKASQHIPFHTITIQNVGLGYDHVAKQYKIVRFFNRDSYIETSFHMECEVFTLGLSDSWRRVGSIPYMLAIFIAAFANGALHWIVEKEIEPAINICTCMVSFDLIMEKISVIPLPIKNHKCMRLTQLEGCLSLADGSTKPLVDIWMLRDYTKHVWIKTYSINLETMGGYVNELRYVIPLAMQSNGNVSIYMMGTGIAQLSHYNPRTKTIMNDEGWKYPYFLSAAYSESLVRLRRM